MANADCALETPLCLSGACVPSDEPEVLWDHARKLLGTERDVHGVVLGLPVRLQAPASPLPDDEARLQIAGFELSDEAPPSDDWRLFKHPDEHELALHSGGLVVVAPVMGHPRHWHPAPADLKPKGPGIDPDLRAIAGYDLLLAVARGLNDAGFVTSPNIDLSVQNGEHFLDLTRPLNLMVSDLMVRKGLNGEQGLTNHLPFAVAQALAARAAPEADPVHANHPGFPRPPAGLESWEVSRILDVTLGEPGTLRLLAPIPVQSPGCREYAAFRIDDGPVHALETGTPTVDVAVPKGQHIITIAANRSCERQLFWLRAELSSDAQIELNHWLSSQPAATDNNARPRLFNIGPGPISDTDGDLIPDAVDLCPDIPDDGDDADQNGLGDACEGVASARVAGEDLELLDTNGMVLSTLDQAGDATFFETLKLPIEAYFQRELIAETVVQNFYAAGNHLVYQRPDKSLWKVNGSGEVERLDSEQQPQTQTICQAASNGYGIAFRSGCDTRSQILGFVPFWLNGAERAASSLFVTTARSAVFALARPTNPILRLAATSLGPAAVLGLRLPGLVEADSRLTNGLRNAQLATLQMGLLHPPASECSGQCQPVRDGAHDIQRHCVDGLCQAAPSEGLCVTRVGQRVALQLSTFSPCRLNENTCGRERCVSRDDSGLVGAIGTMMEARSIGRTFIQPLIGPTDGLSSRVIAACPRALISSDEHFGLPPTAQRALIRALADNEVGSDSLLDVARIEAEPARCKPLSSQWRGQFSTALAPVSVELLDTDGDDIDEVRVGFVLGDKRAGTEPTVYRCFDFTGAHRSEGCNP